MIVDASGGAGKPIASARRRIRAVSFVVIAGVHAALFLALRAEPPAVNLLAPIEIEIVPRGEAVADRTASEAALADAVPVREMPQPATEAPPEEPPPALTPIETPPPALRDPTVPAPPPPSEAPVVTRPPEAVPVPQVRPERPRPKRPAVHRPPTEAKRTPQAEKTAEPAAASAENRPVGAIEGREDLRAARASYAALVSAEINRHKHYPAAARERGETGSVGMAFVVGASGSIVSHALRRSSGSPALDAAAVAMLEASRSPPPPGGVFRGNIDIDFAIGR